MSHARSINSITLARQEAAAAPLEKLRAGSITDFPVYLNREGVYECFCESGHYWTSSDLENLIKDGHAIVFYHTADSAKFDAYAKVAELPSVNTSLAPAARIINITDVGAELTKMLYDLPMTTAAFAKGEEVAHHMVTCIEEDRTCVAALGKLAHHHWYTYYHSARVASYALAIAMEMGLTNRDKLEEMAIGCLFHDIGKRRIKIDILNKNGPLSPAEWDQIRKHPEIGGEIVATSLLAMVPREIILHHHERLDGKGYPHQLTAASILQEVRIASFADTFDALTTNRPYQPGRSKFEALDMIRHKFLEQLDRDCYKAMVLIFKRAGT
jgi:putative nucleotidyltransferase with HDIG domain